MQRPLTATVDDINQAFLSTHWQNENGLFLKKVTESNVRHIQASTESIVISEAATETAASATLTPAFTVTRDQGTVSWSLSQSWSWSLCHGHSESGGKGG